VPTSSDAASLDSCSDFNETKNEREKPLDEDLDDRCNYWASVGECFENPTYMLRNCANACRDRIALPMYGERQRVEDEGTLSVIKSTPEYMRAAEEALPPSLMERCRNGYKDCAYWAGKKRVPRRWTES